MNLVLVAVSWAQDPTQDAQPLPLYLTETVLLESTRAMIPRLRGCLQDDARDQEFSLDVRVASGGDAQIEAGTTDPLKGCVEAVFADSQWPPHHEDEVRFQQTVVIRGGVLHLVPKAHIKGRATWPRWIYLGDELMSRSSDVERTLFGTPDASQRVDSGEVP